MPKRNPRLRSSYEIPDMFFSELKGQCLKHIFSFVFQADHNVDVNTEEDDDGELALWSPEVKIVELVKDHKGLGFSILDYQV